MATARRERSKGGTIQIRLPEAWHEALGVLAADHDLTTVELVRTCIEIGLGLPDGSLSRACPYHTSEARQRYRALADEAARRSEVARCEAVLLAAKRRTAQIARAAGKAARVPAPVIATLQGRRDRETAEELLAGAQAASLEVQRAHDYAAAERAAHAARMRAG